MSYTQLIFPLLTDQDCILIIQSISFSTIPFIDCIWIFEQIMTGKQSPNSRINC